MFIFVIIHEKCRKTDYFKNIFNRRDRIIAVICAFALLCSLSFGLYHIGAAMISPTFAETAVAGTTEESVTAIYAFGDYSISLRNASYIEGGKDDGTMLTDRRYTSAKPLDEDEPTVGWVMVGAKDKSSNFRMTVDIDFGFFAKDICRLYLRAFKSDELGAAMPSEIRFYTSDDGENYSFVGNGTTMTNVSASDCAAIYSIILDNCVDARYMRAVIDCRGAAGNLWLNEVGAAAKGNVFRANSNGSGLFTDEQGLIYRINNGMAEIVGVETEPGGSGGVISPSNASFNRDGSIYTLGAGSDNAIEVISDFIGEGRINYSGVPNNIKYIIIHNTGTTEAITDAERYNYVMHTTQEETSWHYTVDENRIYHSLADSIVGWHAGTGLNYESIGIEICVNGAPTKSSGDFIFNGSRYDEWVDKHFRKSIKNAALLVAELLTRYGLSTDAVIQHYDASEKNCPQWMRNKNGKFVYEGTLWIEFMGYVNEYYTMLNGKSPSHVITPRSNLIIPDYLNTNDGEVYAVSSIGANAFVDMDESVHTVFIGKMIDSISEGCFDGSAGLERVTVASGNGNFRTDSDLILRDIAGNIIFNPDAYVDISPNPKEECTLDIRTIGTKSYVFCKDEGYTLTELADMYGASEYSAVSMDGKNIGTAEKPGTGAVLNFDGARMYLVLLGDANGDTVIDRYDYILVKRTCLGTYYPLTRQKHAMLVTGNEQITVYDYILIKRHVMGTYNIYK